ncbi:short chain oxidoreductase [Mycena rosella]|uniref:Short chain oxidoreductase n=1 Tax=Mycena rosella TaxID=1033263 RepID=A0AAD7D555_MYCRO|nr:short chain oxidoreductase [Mycena rosella]
MRKGTAVVTGAAQGIGRAISLRLAADGFDIALNDIAAKKDQLEGVRDEIVRLGRKSCLFIADVSVEDDVRAMFEGVDVMVANAGICKGSAFLAVPRPRTSTRIDDWNRTFSINVPGTCLCYQYAARQMVAQGRGGRIIGACSLAGKQGRAPNLSCYCASKFAVRGLTQATATELGVHGITVNAYASGQFLSIAGDASLTEYTHAAQQAASTPVRKHGQPEDVAVVVSYLASEEASFKYRANRNLTTNYESIHLTSDAHTFATTNAAEVTPLW